MLPWKQGFVRILTVYWHLVRCQRSVVFAFSNTWVKWNQRTTYVYIWPKKQVLITFLLHFPASWFNICGSPKLKPLMGVIYQAFMLILQTIIHSCIRNSDTPYFRYTQNKLSFIFSKYMGFSGIYPTFPTSNPVRSRNPLLLLNLLGIKLSGLPLSCIER